NLESALETFGYKFRTREKENWVAPDECTSPAGFFNKFTTASMLNEVVWGLGGKAFPEAAYTELNGRWTDGQLPANSPVSNAPSRSAAFSSRLRATFATPRYW